MRLSGLASGMDTETLVKDLMKAERLPLDKLTQKKTYLEWQLDDYRTVNRQLNDFSTFMFDGIMRNSTFIQKTVSSSAPNDISVRNISSTSDFAGTISVSQLAKTATMQTVDKVNGGNVDLTKKLSDLGVTGTQSFTIKAIKADGTLDSVGYTVNVDPTTQTLQDVLNDINKNSGVNAFYDSYTGKIAITAKNSGNAKDTAGNDIAEIQIQDVTGTFASGFMGLPSEATNGQNAIFTFNGLTTERSSNTFQLNGFEVTLKAANNTDINFSSSPDTEKILESVVKFVDEYNKLIEDLNKQIREPKYRDYQPLTDEQKSEMEDKQIEMWEERAKSGTLRNDSLISGMLNKIRMDLQGSVTGKGSLADIGIKTSSNYLDHGKLIIDESKLREAINSHPNKIYEMFSADGATEADKGFARRIRETVIETRKSITSKAGAAGSTNASFALGRNLDSMNDQISRFEDRLQMVENRYWRQFTAMENAIQRANMQSAQLMSSFGGGA